MQSLSPVARLPAWANIQVSNHPLSCEERAAWERGEVESGSIAGSMFIQSSTINPQLGYPDDPAARNRWVVSMRGEKNRLDPEIPYAYLWEEEAGENNRLLPTATILLTNRECPYRCLMCDLWKNTLDFTVPLGAINQQIKVALSNLPSADQIKLYNAGSFFDPSAIPLEDYLEIAKTISEFGRVIVESHPSLIGENCLRFNSILSGKLEVAIGLETAHAPTLEKLNKRFSLDDFRRSAEFLKENDIDLRVFILLRPPFMTELEGIEWAKRSLDFAFDCGAKVCSLIPTRSGNGAMDALEKAGLFSQPSIGSLETAMEYGLELKKGRVFADTWDIERFAACVCSSARAARMHNMNRIQRITVKVDCEMCGEIPDAD